MAKIVTDPKCKSKRKTRIETTNGYVRHPKGAVVIRFKSPASAERYAQQHKIEVNNE